MNALHLTSGQTYSRVDLVLDGETYTAEVLGDAHQARARALAEDVRDALKGGSKSDALNIIEPMDTPHVIFAESDGRPSGAGQTLEDALLAAEANIRPRVLDRANCRAVKCTPKFASVAMDYLGAAHWTDDGLMCGSDEA